MVGSGLRAFANGEGLRLRGHEVCYCTRTEDLPTGLKKKAKRGPREVHLDRLSDASAPPGDPSRMATRGSSKGKKTKKKALEAATVASLSDSTGLAQEGGPLGAPGNPFSFTDTPELHDVVAQVDPDVVLVEAPEEARRLPDGNFKVVLDLFAPRILEQQFQDGAEEREAGRILDSLQRGDEFLFSNERQRYYHLPLLALAGIDCTKSAGLVVPISCPPVMPKINKPKATTFVAGGVFWPWADLSAGLAVLHETLKKSGKGKLHLYGGKYAIRSDTVRYVDPREALPKKSKHLSFKGMVPIDALWDEYSRASIAFDLMAPNPEREINLSFRQIDYLRCGLPIITAPGQVIADELKEFGAGWLVAPDDPGALRKLIESLLSDPKKILEAGKGAQELARQRYTWDQTIDALARRLDAIAPRQRHETVITRLARTQGDLWEEHEENKRLRSALGHMRDDQEKKSVEVRTLDKRIEGLLGSVDQLSDSLTAVSRFKNSSLLYLQEQQDTALKDAAGLAEELERKELDLKKKDDALKSTHRVVTKLKKSVTNLKGELKALTAQYRERDRLVLDLESQCQSLEQQNLSAQAETRDRDREVAVREAAIDELTRKHADLESKKQRELDEQRERLEVERVRAQRTLETAEERRARAIESTKEKSAKLMADLKDRLDTASQERGLFKGRLEEHQARVSELERLVSTKDRAVHETQRQHKEATAQAHAQLVLLREEFLRKLETTEEGSKALIEDVRTRLAILVEERSRLRVLSDEQAGRLRALERDLNFKDQELNARAIKQQEEQARTDRALDEGQKLRDGLREARVKISDLDQAMDARDKDIQALRLDTERLKDRLEQAGYEHTKLLEELDKKEREVTKAQTTRDKTAAKLTAAIKRLEEQVAKGEFELRTTLEESSKKDGEILEAQAERDNLKAKLEADVELLETRLAKAEFEHRTLLEEASKKDSEILDAQAERDAVKARLTADAKGLEERLARTEFEQRTLLEEFAKKESEFADLEETNATQIGQLERNSKQAETLEARLNKTEFERTALEAELDKKASEFNEAQGLAARVPVLKQRLEESEYERRVLETEVEKKTLELEDAQGQRDALAAALQAEREFNANRSLLGRRKRRPKELPAGEN